MYYGKKVCASLKQVRKQIADANGIPYEVTECQHQGNCKGTCPKCESELRYIENQLSLRKAAGMAVSIVGLSLGVAATFASCSAPQPAAPAQPTESVQTIPPSTLEEYEGEIVFDGDVCAPESEPEQESKPSDQCIIEDNLELLAGGEDVEIDGMMPQEEYGSYEEEEGDTDAFMGAVVEPEPEFPGGTDSLVAFIKKNLRYPEFLAESCIQGRVTLSFVVEKDGSITDIQEMRSPSEYLTEEAIRVVKLMPKWIPAKQHGQAVRVKYMLPITFRLE